MGKVVLFNMVTVDGFFAGPNGEIDWHNVDEEFNDFAIRQLDAADGLIFGRATYEGMASYWPTPQALASDPEIAGKMNAMAKYVFSRTLDRAGWNNTRLIKGDAAAELGKLREQPGCDLLIFGSADLAATFIQNGLIDEYRLMVNPVVLGRGRPLFQNVKEPVRFKLTSTRKFRNGNVLFSYLPERG